MSGGPGSNADSLRDGQAHEGLNTNLFAQWEEQP